MDIILIPLIVLTTALGCLALGLGCVILKQQAHRPGRDENPSITRRIA